MKPLIVIEKPVTGGYGLGHYRGKAVFIPFVLPGETVSFHITSEKRDFCFGRALDIIDPSSHRTVPQCPNFTVCGGCDYLHCDYPTELNLKKTILADSLKRIGKFEMESLPSIETLHDRRFHYRSHATVKIDKMGRPGFYKKDSRIHVPLPGQGCLLLEEPINRNFGSTVFAVQEELRAAVDYRGTVFLSTEKNCVVRDIINGIVYDRDTGSFFQANRYLRSKMLELVGEMSYPASEGDFLDLACGVGFFSLMLGTRGLSGYGFDTDRKSIAWARHNAVLNNIENVGFSVSDISGIASHRYRPSTVVVDPPRAGISKKGRSVITAMQPRRIISVSCDPSTFSRDLADFMKAGYTPKRFILIDMFPATAHMEIISILETQ